MRVCVCVEVFGREGRRESEREERRSVPSLQAPKPANYVKESADQSQFYTNRIIKEYKGKDE